MNRPERQEVNRSPDRQLEICPNPSCSSSLVYPVDWSQVGYTHYQLLLRCPECEYTEDGLFPAEQVERFEDALDEDRLEFLKQGAKLEQEIMAMDVETFARAIHADLIDADDFRV